MTIQAIMTRLTDKQLLRYLVSGGISFGVDQLLFLLFFYVWSWKGFAASIVSLAIGWTVNYLLSQFFVFSNQAAIGRSLVRYLLLASANFGFTTLFIAVTVDGLHAPAFIMKPLVGVLVILWTFYAYRRFVFTAAPTKRHI
jgi:putative flippase GtrA